MKIAEQAGDKQKADKLREEFKVSVKKQIIKNEALLAAAKTAGKSDDVLAIEDRLSAARVLYELGTGEEYVAAAAGTATRRLSDPPVAGSALGPAGFGETELVPPVPPSGGPAPITPPADPNRIREIQRQIDANNSVIKSHMQLLKKNQAALANEKDLTPGYKEYREATIKQLEGAIEGLQKKNTDLMQQKYIEEPTESTPSAVAPAPSAVPASAAEKAEVAAVFDKFPCIYAGNISARKGSDACRGQSSLKGLKGLNALDPNAECDLECAKPKAICNPLLFGVAKEKDKKGCFKALCVRPSVSATKQCATVAKANDEAIKFFIDKNPEKWDEFKKDIEYLTSEKYEDEFKKLLRTGSEENVDKLKKRIQDLRQTLARMKERITKLNLDVKFGKAQLDEKAEISFPEKEPKKAE